MTRNNIELLIKDISCRIPYGVIVNVNGVSNVKLTSVSWYGEVGVDDGSAYLYPISEVKPYLFPMSSMTEEHKEDMIKSSCGIGSDKNVFDWYNKNHFDYRGLIPMGLANDATGLNIY